MFETYCATTPFYIYIYLSNGVRHQTQLLSNNRLKFDLFLEEKEQNTYNWILDNISI